MSTSSSRLVYVNGAFVPIETASVPVMDRGFLFADGIYEVTAVIAGRLADAAPHLDRLDRSLREIGIANPHDTAHWTRLLIELARRNRLTEGLIYIEVTRGVQERDFVPASGLKPTVVMFTQSRPVRTNANLAKGVSVISVPDLRWVRRDIKSVALLAQVLAKTAAAEAGASEAWMVEEDQVTEGASSTAFILTRKRELITRPLSQAVLPGITRHAILDLARELDLVLVERPFTLDEAKAAQEAFLTSASTIVLPVVSIDGAIVGDGAPGPATLRLRNLYLDAVMAQAPDVLL